ncbi:MAG: patatin-like phospholipase family protein [Chthoniobacterales bacterium]
MGRRCIRGIISIEILAGIESELRKSSENPKLVLADYFDYVAGTSTGAIMATLIALGYSRSATGFLSSKWRGDVSQRAPVGALSHEIEDDKLSKILGDAIGEDTTLGSEKLHTLLMMVLRNATTDSPSPLTYIRSKIQRSHWCRLQFKLTPLAGCPR